MNSDLNGALAALIEELAVEADPHRRDMRLLEVVQAASGAAGACLWHLSGGRWLRLAGRGDRAVTPSAGQVEAVALGQLECCLPAGRLVAHMGERALGLGGLPLDRDKDELLDQVDALLLTASLAAGPPESDDLADLILPALPGAGEPAAGTHTLEPADLSELRQLLRHLSADQEQLARAEDLPALDRERRKAALEQDFEHAGDLLLEGLHRDETARHDDTSLAWALRAALHVDDLAAQVDLDPDAVSLPLDLKPGALQALIQMAVESAGVLPEGSTRLVAHTERRERAGVVLHIERGGPHSNSPGQFSLADLRTQAALLGVPVEFEDEAIRLWLPAKERGKAA